jgi:predicted membrane protein
MSWHLVRKKGLNDQWNSLSIFVYFTRNQAKTVTIRLKIFFLKIWFNEIYILPDIVVYDSDRYSCLIVNLFLLFPFNVSNGVVKKSYQIKLIIYFWNVLLLKKSSYKNKKESGEGDTMGQSVRE